MLHGNLVKDGHGLRVLEMAKRRTIELPDHDLYDGGADSATLLYAATYTSHQVAWTSDF
jgi:hypothetical protein